MAPRKYRRYNDFTSKILSSMGDGVISTDIHGRILYMNPKATEITGWKANEAYKRDFQNVLPLLTSEGQPIESPIDAALKSDSSVGLPNNTITITKDGVSKYISASTSPIKNENGSTTGVAMVFRDITRLRTLEIQMEKSRDYSKNLLDHLPSLIWQADKAMALKYVNRRWGEYTGSCTQKSLYYGWTDVIHPHDLDKWVQKNAEAARHRIPFEVELRIKHYHGKYRWCLNVGNPYYDLDGRFAGYIGTIIDITELKETSEALNRYKLLSENTRDIMLFTDIHGNIIEANKAAVQAYGYTYEELTTMNLQKLRNDSSLTQQELRKSYLKWSYYEVVHHRKDGSSFPVEVSSQGTLMDGKHILLYIVRDISERKRAERKLSESQIKYRSLFMNMHKAYVYCKVIMENHKSIDLKFTEVNEAFEIISGMTKRQVVGKRYKELFCQAKSSFFGQIDKVLEDGVRYKEILEMGKSVQLNDVFSDISKKWYSITIYSPKKMDLVILISDITKSKEAEIQLIKAKEEAEAANRAKSEFLANMSHEIRTPINGMVGMLDLTMLTDLDENQKDNLVTAKTCANSLLNIINDILDFSKMEVGKLTLQNENFNLQELMNEIIKVHSQEIIEKGLNLIFTFPPGIPPFLLGDPYRIRQIIDNLLNNAIKFTSEGEIIITVEKLWEHNDEMEVQFSIEDTGVGIKDENINRLFKSFSQGDNTFTRNHRGTGLGLAISKQLVEMMGGRIWVESKEDVGSTFYFIIKLHMGSEEIENIREMTEVPKTIKPLKVLLAEDDGINQQVIKKILEGKGHGVEIANNGKEVVKLFSPKKYDVVLMDIQMPEMNGIEAAEKIKEIDDPQNPTPIVALTAYALRGDKEKFLSFGMDGYISKPIHMSDLFYTLEKVTSPLHQSLDGMPIGVVLGKDGNIEFKNNSSNAPLQEILPFLEEMEKYIQRLKEGINDLDSVENISNYIKNLANKISAEEIKDAAFRIELAARRGNMKNVEIYIKKIKDEFQLYRESLK